MMTMSWSSGIGQDRFPFLVVMIQHGRRFTIFKFHRVLAIEKLMQRGGVGGRVELVLLHQPLAQFFENLLGLSCVFGSHLPQLLRCFVNLLESQQLLDFVDADTEPVGCRQPGQAIAISLQGVIHLGNLALQCCDVRIFRFPGPGQDAGKELRDFRRLFQLDIAPTLHGRRQHGQLCFQVSRCLTQPGENVREPICAFPLIVYE
jgi:hypothetical protein